MEVTGATVNSFKIDYTIEDGATNYDSTVFSISWATNTWGSGGPASFTEDDLIAMFDQLANEVTARCIAARGGSVPSSFHFRRQPIAITPVLTAEEMPY